MPGRISGAAATNANQQSWELDLVTPVAVAAGQQCYVGYSTDDSTGPNMYTAAGGAMDNSYFSADGSGGAAYPVAFTNPSLHGTQMGSFYAYIEVPAVWVRRSGVWVKAPGMSVRRGGAWAIVGEVYVRRGGAWVRGS